MSTMATLLLAVQVVRPQTCVARSQPRGLGQGTVWDVCVAGGSVVRVCVWGAGRGAYETSRGASFPLALGPAGMLITALLMDPG